MRRSPQAPFRCSDWTCASRSALPILWLVYKLSGLRNGSKMVKCLGSETSLVAHSVRQPAVQTCNHLHTRPTKIGHSVDSESSSHISCLAHITGLRARTTSSKSQHHLCQRAFGTPWRLRTRLIAGHCGFQDILSLAECSCDEHHVCAYSRRPHIQLRGSDLNGRQFTTRCKVLPRRLCSKLCNIIISREIGNR